MSTTMTMKLKKQRAFNGAVMLSALRASFIKLDPRTLVKNPVMFVVEIVSIITTVFCITSAYHLGIKSVAFDAQITLWLWVTLLFANFSEALAENRGKAQAEALRNTQQLAKAKVIKEKDSKTYETIPAINLKKGMLVLIQEGDIIPGDGDIIKGMATVDESAITGESEAVIRESGGDKCAVTAGTVVISDEIVVKISSSPGDSFLDRMINLVEGAKRQKTPNEIALTILLAGFTLIFIVAVGTIQAFAHYTSTSISIVILIALFVTLIPTTIAGLLSAVGISGMNRLLKVNILAKSGRAVEAAGDVDTLLLDKTGTITLGNRRADELLCLPGVQIEDLVKAAYLSSVGDDTIEGKSIIELIINKYELNPKDLQTKEVKFIPFSAYTRMSGINLGKTQIRKGATSAICEHIERLGGVSPSALLPLVEGVANKGGTPLVVSRGGRVLGVIYLKDIVKKGIRERFWSYVKWALEPSW